MIKFLAGAAALALAAATAQADPGGGKGGGDKGRGNDHGAAQGGGMGKGNVAGHGGAKADGSAKTRDGAARGGGKPDKIEDGHAGRSGDRADRGRDKARDDRGGGRTGFGDLRTARKDGVRDPRERFEWHAFRERGLIGGCPPGLAKKNNGCTPPGLARSGDRLRWSFLDRPDWWGLNGFGEGRYGYYDGSLIRFGDGNRILGFLPLLGGALAPGNRWPSFYEPVAVPDYYRDYYGLGPVGGYRYADDVLYRVDPDTLAISSVAALLTGDSFGVGQPLPAGYDIYNVPYGYRDRYADGPDGYYRYSDGYIYQADPETRLITAVIGLLT